jgi:hypothetical protein
MAATGEMTIEIIMMEKRLLVRSIYHRHGSNKGMK